MRPIAVLSQQAPDSELARHLSDAGFDVWLVPHLYHVAEGSEIWRELENAKGATVFIVPLHPRPTEALLGRHGIWDGGSLAIDSRLPDSALAAQLASRFSPPAGQGPIRSLDEATGNRWYPLVDESRCTHCGSCFQFCLFGVYTMDSDKRVRIVNPDRCKPGCPACSRICPQGALMFPLYDKDPAIAGAPGQFPKPDAAARKMYYARTGLLCPRCGQTGKPPPKAGAAACEECGRPAIVKGGGPDALDALIDGLERMQERRE